MLHMKSITILTTEYKKETDSSQIFLNERLAALNSENLLNFWEEINEEAPDMARLQILLEKEREFLKKIGLDEQAMDRRVNTAGPTSEHWPHRVIKEALEIRRSGADWADIRTNISTAIENAKQEAENSTELDWPRVPLLIKRIDADGKTSYTTIQNIENLDSALQELTEIQRYYIRMTANQSYEAGVIKQSSGMIDLVPAAQFHYNSVTINMTEPNKTQVFVKCSMGCNYRDPDTAQISSTVGFYSVKRDISDIQHRKVHGISFSDGNIRAGAILAVADLSPEGLKKAESMGLTQHENLTKLSPKFLEELKNAAAESILATTLNRPSRPQDLLETELEGIAQVVLPFKGEEATPKKLFSVGNEIRNFAKQINNEVNPTNLQKLVETIFKVINYLVEIILKPKSHVQDIEAQRAELMSRENEYKI
ncbi:hypothetical protein [Candidatus Midichloria mitochondrii]|nr:hypothetical protein [Candidatus Midichloria mitochondrii]